MFTILIVCSIVLILFYLIEFIFMFSDSGETHTKNGTNLPEDTTHNGISLIVPLRNEAPNISNLVRTLLELKSPRMPFEIILVDDFSTDETYHLLKKHEQQFSNLKILKSKTPIGNLNGKPNALDTGIDAAGYDIIAVTDADMTLNSNWLISIENYFRSDPEIDMICGPTIVRPTNLWGSIQSLDWSYLMTIASYSFNAGNPISAIGNNMIFTKQSYRGVGGYEKIPFSITEDFELFRTFLSEGKHVVFPLERDMLHVTEPNKNISSFISQRKRWIRGGLSINRRGMITLLAGLAGQLALILAVVSSFIVFIFVLGIKIAVDLKVINTFYQRMNLNYRLFHFISFEFYYFCYSLFMPVIFLIRPKVVWKDRTY